MEYPWARSQHAQQIKGRLILDALSDDPETETMAELDRRPNELPIPLATRDVSDELTIELQLLHGEAAEIRKRGKTGTEFID